MDQSSSLVPVTRFMNRTRRLSRERNNAKSQPPDYARTRVTRAKPFSKAQNKLHWHTTAFSAKNRPPLARLVRYRTVIHSKHILLLRGPQCTAHVARAIFSHSMLRSTAFFTLDTVSILLEDAYDRYKGEYSRPVLKTIVPSELTPRGTVNGSQSSHRKTTPFQQLYPCQVQRRRAGCTWNEPGRSRVL